MMNLSVAALRLLESDSGSSPGLRRSVSAETFATQHRPAGGGLERHAVGLTALIARDLKSLAVATSAPGTTKVIAARITTRLATFRMGQIPFLVILLFAVSEGKGVSAFRAGNIDVWHGPSLLSGLRQPALC